MTDEEKAEHLLQLQANAMLILVGLLLARRDTLSASELQTVQMCQRGALRTLGQTPDIGRDN